MQGYNAIAKSWEEIRSGIRNSMQKVYYANKTTPKDIAKHRGNVIDMLLLLVKFSSNECWILRCYFIMQGKCVQKGKILDY